MHASRPAPSDVKTVGILGIGVIGSSWTIHFLRQGLDVIAWDQAPEAEKNLRKMVADKWPAMIELGLGEGAAPERLSFAPSMEVLCQQASIVQESTPEELSAKRKLFAELDRIAPQETIISSSTSGLLMSDIQRDCQRPERTVVCHPFNPPYLIPFCEVVGGQRSDPAVVEWTARFFEHSGKKVARMPRELPGLIGNRLQDAMWREALHMVDQGECTVQDIDRAVAYGPGLRWAIMGPCMTMALCGGEGGMRRMLEHFGPSLREPWTRLEAPPLTDKLFNDMVEQFERSTQGRSMRQLAREMDECLIKIQTLLQEYRKEHGIER